MRFYDIVVLWKTFGIDSFISAWEKRDTKMKNKLSTLSFESFYGKPDFSAFYKMLSRAHHVYPTLKRRRSNVEYK